jgi:hypothetical protein
MKFKNDIIKTVRAEKDGWSSKEIGDWVEAKLEELKKTSPALWQFVEDSQHELFQRVCEVSSEEHREGICPAEEARQYLLLRLVELIEILKAHTEVEELRKLWKRGGKRKPAKDTDK